MEEVTLSQLQKKVKELTSSLTPQKTGATVLALHGDLGAGKTTFVQTLAGELGIEESVMSPTFVIEKVYALPKKNKLFKKLIHIDAYRIEDSKELTQLGWDDIVSDPKNIIAVEWAERVTDILPKSTINIALSHPTQSKDIEVRGIEVRTQQM